MSCSVKVMGEAPGANTSDRIVSLPPCKADYAASVTASARGRTSVNRDGCPGREAYTTSPQRSLARRKRFCEVYSRHGTERANGPVSLRLTGCELRSELLNLAS